MSYKFLITGGSGFIGSNIVSKLLEDGYFVRILDNFSTGKRENIIGFQNYSNFEVIEGDLRSFHTVRKAVSGMDYILHLGALPSVQRSIDDPITTNDVNVLGTLNILEAAKEFNIKKLVYSSSSSVYGDIEILPKNEDLPVSPLSPYAISKYTAERYCKIFYDLYGLETVCLRYFNVFGPNQDPSSQYSAVIPKFIRLMLNDMEPVIYGDGKQSRDFTYVENNVNANILSVFSSNISGNVYNIACGTRFNLNDLVRMVNKILNKNIEPKYMARKAGDVLHSLASIEKAKKDFDYKVSVDFEEGLSKMVDFMRKKM
ncbi:MAG: NAD-dependent epimerase/dehydratase family protein [Candidatus Delongbacteria bacterium]|nr:NAD-dependent epimerase/dehydratase family protein [Candidatus Delongbacteria bacterium]